MHSPLWLCGTSHVVLVVTMATGFTDLSFGETWKTACPVAYDSMQHNATKWNYLIHEKELLAIIHALKKWHLDLLRTDFILIIGPLNTLTLSTIYSSNNFSDKSLCHNTRWPLTWRFRPPISTERHWHVLCCQSQSTYLFLYQSRRGMIQTPFVNTLHGLAYWEHSSSMVFGTLETDSLIPTQETSRKTFSDSCMIHLDILEWINLTQC